MKTILTFLVCATLAMACDQSDNANVSDTGEWILYEQGYSPGAGYITEDVAPVPAQTMTLNADGTIEATIKGWEKFKYYLILEQDNDNKILALYESKPLNSNPDVNKLATSYQMAFDEEGNLKLYFRWCIEGCHLALKKYNR